MMSRILGVVCLVAVFSFIAGCGGGDGFDRVAISGTVTCEGVDSPSGSIMGSAAEAGTEAPNFSAPLSGGKFSVAKDRGPVAGSYTVEISLVTGEAADAGESPEGEVETGPEVIYRTTVEIPEGGSDSLAIELTPADLDDGDM